MKNIIYLLLILGSLDCTPNFNTTNNTEDDIRISSMKQEGINAALIKSLDSAITKGVYPNIHSVLIAKNNKLVYEKYWSGLDVNNDSMVMVLHGKDSLHRMRSVTKSIVSACIGIAISQGIIKSVNQRVFDFFPEYSNQDTGLKSSLTIKHLLTMSSGLKWNEEVPYDNPENSDTKMFSSGNPIKYILSQPMDLPPAMIWKYNGGSTQLLASIIQKTTGKEIDQFANQYLFKPLGINGFYWTKYPGTELPWASGGLRLRSRDLLKFALLYNNRGKWNGKPIIPASWVDESFESQIKRTSVINPGEYGYQFWIYNYFFNNKSLRIISAFGNGDQRIYWDKLHDLVVVFTAGNYNKWNIKKNTHAILKEYILPAIRKK